MFFFFFKKIKIKKKIFLCVFFFFFCKTMILLVVLYGCAFWSLTLKDSRQRVFVNRVPKVDKVTGE